MIFTYAPSSGNRSLFQFADATAALQIDQATLSAPVPGMQLDTGRLIVRNRNFLRNDGATSASQGISFGSSLTLDRPSGATLELLSGFNG